MQLSWSWGDTVYDLRSRGSGFGTREGHEDALVDSMVHALQRRERLPAPHTPASKRQQISAPKLRISVSIVKPTAFRAESSVSRAESTDGISEPNIKMVQSGNRQIGAGYPAWQVRKVIGARPMVAAAVCGTKGSRMSGAARLIKKLGVIGKMRMTVR
eukprot:308372-Rhodomonas_salina.1